MVGISCVLAIRNEERNELENDLERLVGNVLQCFMLVQCIVRCYKFCRPGDEVTLQLNEHK